MCLHVMLGSFLGMMGGMHVMAVRHMGMMRGRLVVPFLMMLGSFPVMVGRMLMVLGGLGVVMRSFLRHDRFPFAWRIPNGELESACIVWRACCMRIANK